MYTAEDALKSLEIFKPVKYSEIVDVAENITVRFNDAGHMLGSSIIEVWVTEDVVLNFQKAPSGGDISDMQHEKIQRERWRERGK